MLEIETADQGPDCAIIRRERNQCALHFGYLAQFPQAFLILYHPDNIAGLEYVIDALWFLTDAIDTNIGSCPGQAGQFDFSFIAVPECDIGLFFAAGNLCFLAFSRGRLLFLTGYRRWRQNSGCLYCSNDSRLKSAIVSVILEIQIKLIDRFISKYFDMTYGTAVTMSSIISDQSIP